MAEETQYTANTGVVAVTSANSNLDGTGTLSTVLTGASNGTLIKNVYIKARTDTASGMIRLFVTGGGNTRLLHEVEVPANTKSAINPAWQTVVPLSFTLQSGYALKASTEIGSPSASDSFVVFAEGLNWTYYDTSVRQDTTKYTSNNGIAQISTANSSLFVGTTGSAYTAGAAASGFLGSSIASITVKSSISVTAGMVRLWIRNSGGTKFCFWEIPVNTRTKSGTAQTFEHVITFDNDLDIAAGWGINASTENAENFNVVVEGNDWKYEA